MQKKLKMIFILTFTLSIPIIFFANMSFASYIVVPPDLTTTEIVVKEKNPIKFLSAVIAYAIGLAGVLGVIGITWWGIQMVLSTGEDEKLKKARYMLIYSMIGVLLAGLAYLIVETITQSRNLG